jgi:tetratricopeptide (TPR) repeat protein
MSGGGKAVDAAATVGRNDRCPCGSGKKFKHCCQAKKARTTSFAASGSAASLAARQSLQALILQANKLRGSGSWADLIPVYSEIVRLAPNSAEAHHDCGILYLRFGRLREAAVLLRRAVELRPSYEGALRGLVDALEADGRQSEALAAYRKLSRSAGDTADRLYYSAKALAIEDNFEEAEKELRRALARVPQHPRVLLALGALLSEQGRFREAVGLLAPAIDVAPSAFQLLAAAKRMESADRPLMDRMSLTAERSEVSALERIDIHFALGKAFDDLGEYAEAMRHYELGNRLRARSVRLNRQALSARYDSMIASFTNKVLSHGAMAAAANPDGDLPVFIVGMPRSGTTLVEQILSSHPAVAAGGELTFWEDQLNAWSASKNRSFGSTAALKAAKDYRALLRKFGPEARHVTDKAPANFERLWLIRLALPDARIIHCRRDPVDTCLSIYFANLWGGQDYAWDRGDLVFYYRQYERLMDHWRRVLPADRFAEVDYERLIADREAETRRLVAFCGLNWDDACLAPERNRRVVKTASLWQARQPVYETSVGRWRHYEPWLGELRKLLPGSNRAEIGGDRSDRKEV